MADHPSIVLHTSWRGRAITLAAPVILLALGGYGIADAFRWFPFLLFVLGLVLAFVAVADYPLYTVIGSAGVRRRCLLRTQTLAWDQVTTIGRPAQNSRWRRDHPSAGAGGQSHDPLPSPTKIGGAQPDLQSTPKGGLVAEVKGRPHLLCDQVESRAEHDTLVIAMRQWEPSVPVRASRPGESVPPTWLHKKRRGSASDGLVDLLA